MSITMHELADRLRSDPIRLGLKGNAKLEVIFDGIGLVASATLISQDCPRNLPDHACRVTRTKIV